MCWGGKNRKRRIERGFEYIAIERVLNYRVCFERGFDYKMCFERGFDYKMCFERGLNKKRRREAECIACFGSA